MGQQKFLVATAGPQRRTAHGATWRAPHQRAVYLTTCYRLFEYRLLNYLLDRS